jgi:hypothetical protein
VWSNTVCGLLLFLVLLRACTQQKSVDRRHAANQLETHVAQNDKLHIMFSPSPPWGVLNPNHQHQIYIMLW